MSCLPSNATPVKHTYQISGGLIYGDPVKRVWSNITWNSSYVFSWKYHYNDWQQSDHFNCILWQDPHGHWYQKVHWQGYPVLILSRLLSSSLDNMSQVGSYFCYSKTIVGAPRVLEMFCFCLVALCWLNIYIASAEANYMTSERASVPFPSD